MVKSRLILVALLVSLVGCDLVAPDQGAPDVNRAAIYLSLAYLENQGGVPTPAPKPSPDGSEKCWACSGTGRQGDGTTEQACRICGGSGKLPEGLPSEDPREQVPRLVTLAEALSQQGITSEPLLIFLFEDEPEGPIGDIIAEEKFLADVRKLGIVTHDKKSIWKVESENPVVVLFSTDAKPGDSPPQLDSLNSGSSQELLTQLEEWIDEIK